ncbi:MAG: Thiolase [Candidatus Roizmanbacteria bacterium GW2011_GWA2_32_13]|uniref:Thiolase n=1 Tax=Candidatus Roizmanbacteria bacterium GW2011_GWA2_32_13 TaxID=1618475 RepID=A0A0G0BZ60_9BACT|nr:MAG: Thiolase [Candidatus Roizmanbacteria bacterium GW2011_GWA2_32_13]
MNYITGYYTTRFGELWDKSLFDLVEEALRGVLKQNNLESSQIDAVFFGNMLAGVLENNLHSTSKIAEILKINVPIFRSEAACASGGVAFNLAKTYLDANPNQNILVIGAEKMTDYSPEETITGLSAAASGEEQEAGLTFSGLYAMMANLYIEKYHYTEENLAYVSVKNHYHGSLNEKAHFRRKISIENVLQSPYVAYPLKVLDSSPISDGASAVVLTNNQDIAKKQKHTVTILASEVATDTISLKGRKNLEEILATKNAADKAFKKAKINREDIGVAEVHDCFSIAEILAMENLGFWKKGQGGERIKELSTMYGNNGDLIVNTSGGLKAAGHPVGATGIKQIGEIFLQLTKQAEKRQVRNVKYGLAHNVGGSGGTAVVTILGI